MSGESNTFAVELKDVGRSQTGYVLFSEFGVGRCPGYRTEGILVNLTEEPNAASPFAKNLSNGLLTERRLARQIYAETEVRSGTRRWAIYFPRCPEFREFNYQLPNESNERQMFAGGGDASRARKRHFPFPGHGRGQPVVLNAKEKSLVSVVYFPRIVSFTMSRFRVSRIISK